MVSDAFRNFFLSSFSVPFLERLIRDFAFDQKVSEFASLSLAFEWHTFNRQRMMLRRFLLLPLNLLQRIDSRAV